MIYISRRWELNNKYFAHSQCFHSSYFIDDRENGTDSSKSNGKGIEFDYNFMIICRYFNFVEKTEDHFIANSKFTSY